ncbi:class I SAM-dependent methyltransferase [Streptomyces sp. NPDC096324]|uniref:class I SAM-dependent methyltransferase n=1 Tax=Streptomyces sp. NPDC096324 TaxID=3366085 RepID=UPI00381F7D58
MSGTRTRTKTGPDTVTGRAAEAVRTRTVSRAGDDSGDGGSGSGSGSGSGGDAGGAGRGALSGRAARSWAADPYAEALGAGRGPLFLRRADGWLLPLEVERWCARADAVDLQVLAYCEGSVLDVGCGPGRLVAELAARGRPSLGIDVSEAAVARTVRLGGRALHRSVFEPLPGEGRWGTALLVDGNIGIGGDPAALLRRTAELLAPGGLLIAETVTGADIDERVDVRIVRAAHPGDTGHPHPHAHPTDAGAAGSGNTDEAVGGQDASGDRTAFPWARLGTPALLRHATRAGWRADAQWAAGGRSFVALRSGPRREARKERRTSSSAEPANSAAVISSQRARNPSAGRAVADR